MLRSLTRDVYEGGCGADGRGRCWQAGVEVRAGQAEQWIGVEQGRGRWGQGGVKSEEDGQETAVEGKVGSGAAPDRRGATRWTGGCEGEGWG
jgi:hypothetical protein